MGESQRPELSRRNLLRASAATAAAAGLVTGPAAAAAAAAPAPPLALTRDPVQHALRRLTYGQYRGLVAAVRRSGVNAWLERQLRPSSIADPYADRIVRAHFPHMLLSAAELRARYDDTTAWKAVHQLAGITLVRAIWSERQLLEVVHGFWSDHFHTHPTDGATVYAKIEEDRQLRANAFSTFGALLHTSASSPAMLAFLDNDESSADAINENYGRELLELHTVGLAGGYTEADVRNAALAMTGWTYDPETYVFTYRPEMHYVGPLSVLGWTHENSDASPAGVETGRSLLAYLASHPATARHISTKLCRRFVADRPPPALVDSTTRVFLATNGSVPALLRHIVRSREFAASTGRKVRRPFDMVAASMRATGGRYRASHGQQGAGELLWRLTEMGHSPFEWIDPDGYPDTAEAWLSSVGVLGRWNTALAIGGSWFSGVETRDARTLAGGARRPARAGALVDALTIAIAGQKFAAPHRKAILAFMEAAESTVIDDETLGWRGPGVVGLILASPYMQVR